MSVETFEIKGRKIGDGYPAYIIAEMSANHAGSIERAKEIIRAAKEAGADCLKIQTYTPDTITINCNSKYFHIDEGTWEGDNLYHLYSKAYTPWEWHKELKEEADRVGIDFFSTPFDNTAVDLLEEIGVEFYKIASFELVDLPLLRYVASKGKPIIMSTGMASLEEIKEAVNTIYETGNHKLALMKCSSAYPAIPEDMHLSNIPDMKQRFQIPIGLSDHSMGSFSSQTAVAMGANIIEKHFCLGREIENPDSSFSMTPEEFRQMVEDVRKTEAAMGKIAYGVMKQEETNVNFRRSVFVVKDVKAGETFTKENIRCIRPGYGCKPKYYDEILGKTAKKDAPFGTPFTFDLIHEDCSLKHLEEEKTSSIREATMEDLMLYYEWTNDPLVRANSFQTHTISLEEHSKWFTKKIADPDALMYVYEEDGIPVGQVRLEKNGEMALLSLSVDSKYRGHAILTKMMREVEQDVKSKHPELKGIEGEVKTYNVACLKQLVGIGYERMDVSKIRKEW